MVKMKRTSHTHFFAIFLNKIYNYCIGVKAIIDFLANLLLFHIGLTVVRIITFQSFDKSSKRRPRNMMVYS